MPYKKFFKTPFLLSCFFVSTCFAYENEEIISEAKTHLAKSALFEEQIALPNAAQWANFLLKMRNGILNIHTVRSAIDYAQTQIAFDHRRSTWLDEIKIYETTLKAEFPHFAETVSLMSDSSYSTPSSLFHYNGRPVSIVFYWHYRYVLQCLNYIEHPKLICEIGGGYGALARLWMINPILPSDTYILLDFPECLFFAETFLKANFRNDKEIKILHIDDISLEQLYDPGFLYKTILLCPVGKEKLLNSLPVDLIINTGSMQEMTEDWVDYWMQWIDQSQGRYFYSLNYFGLPFTRKPPHSSNVYAPRLSNQWVCLLRKQKSPFCPPWKEVSTFAEILAQRNESLLDTNLLRINFNSILNEKLNLQRLLDCLDILRLCPEQELMWQLMCRVFKDMPFMPQETFYLVKWLKKNGTTSFLQDKQAKLNFILPDQIDKPKQMRSRKNCNRIRNMHKQPEESGI